MEVFLWGVKGKRGNRKRGIGMKLENGNPTETEKKLFRYMGLYLIRRNENSIEYAPIHVDDSIDINKDFPTIINIDRDMVEWNDRVVFDELSETVSLNTFYDIDGIFLILKRMEELNYKYFIIVN